MQVTAPIDTAHASRPFKPPGLGLRQISRLPATADGGPAGAARIQVLAQARGAPVDARIACLTLVRPCLAAVAPGDAESLSTDPDGRFLADCLAVAPEPEPEGSTA